MEYCGGKPPVVVVLLRIFGCGADLNHRTHPHRVCAYDGWGHGTHASNPQLVWVMRTAQIR